MESQQKVLQQALKKNNVWLAYSYYQRRATIYGFERISLKKFKKNYWN